MLDANFPAVSLTKPIVFIGKEGKLGVRHGYSPGFFLYKPTLLLYSIG